MSDSVDAVRSPLTHSADITALILEITQRIASGGQLNALLTDIIQVALRGTRADGIRIVLHSPSLPISYIAGTAADKMTGFDALIWRAVWEHREVEIGDLTGVEAGSEFEPVKDSFGAIMAMPLNARQSMHGLLWAAYDKPRQFSEQEKVFLSVVVGQTAVAIDNAYAFDAARRGREQLAAILSSSADPILVVDAQTEIVLLNPAAEEVFNVQAGSVTGRAVDEVITAEQLISLFKEPSPDQDRGEIVEWQTENGHTFAPRISDVRDDTGTLTGRVLILRDITRYRMLRDNQSEFVSTVSHDLRSPLAYMHGFAQMLPMVGPLNDKQKGFADKIMVGISQMTDLVDKILDAGRLDPEGNYQLNRETCDVAKMVSEIVDMNTQPAEKKGLKLSANIASALPILNLDSVMLRRAVNNLVDNAIKYTPENGAVTVSALIRDNDLVLSVKDSGLGISPENQKTLFRRFQRVRRREHQAVKGSGLGLFIVKNVAQKHGGDAWVESVEGQGSTFNIKLPLDGQNLIGAGAADSKK